MSPRVRARVTGGIAALLAAAAVSLPPRAAAEWLAGGAASRGVVAGLWIGKMLLAGHAAALWWWFGRRGAPASTPASRERASDSEAGPGEKSGEIPFAGVVALPRNRELWVVGCVLAVGIAVRLVGSGQGLWFDEIKTLVRYVSHPFGAILTTYDDQNQHMLYSLLARMSTVAFGDGAMALRLPAILFGVGSLWAVYRFGLAASSRLEAILATTLLAVSYHHVWFSQNARGYTGLLFWTLLASTAFLGLLRNRGPSPRGLAVGYGAAVALAMYTHLTAAVLPLAHALIAAWILWRPPAGHGRPPAGPIVAGLALAVTLTAQLYAPVLFQMAEVLLQPSLAGTAIAWKDPLWLARETVAGLVAGLPGGLAALFVVAVVAAAGLASFVRRAPVVAAVMMIPLLATAVIILALGHNLWPRFFFFGAGFAVLIAIRGVFEIAARFMPRKGAPVATAAVAVAAVLSLATVPGAWGLKQDFDGAEAYVDSSRLPDDAVVVLDMCILPYREYRGRQWLTVRDAEELEAVEKAHPRTWVLYSFPTSLRALQPDVWSRVDSRYREAAVFPGTVRGGDIHVMLAE